MDKEKGRHKINGVNEAIRLFGYLGSKDGGSVPEPTLQDMLGRTYNDRGKPAIQDGTQQHQMRQLLEAAIKKGQRRIKKLR